MTPRIEGNLYKIATENAEALYEEFGGAEGVWVTEDDLPSDASKFTQRELKRDLSPHGAKEVLDGHPVTEVELRALREQRLENILTGDYFDEWARIPGYCFAEVTDADGNSGIALILCKGDSFSGLYIWLNGIFDTREAAKAYMKENGWIT
jgi:hypothetical protein